MQRRQFTEEFKREALKLARQPGSSKSAIARDLGIGANLLSRWAREQGSEMAGMHGSKSDGVSSQEFDRMRRELAKVKMERDILKNVWSAPDLQVRFYQPTEERFAQMYSAYVGNLKADFLALMESARIEPHKAFSH